MENQINKDTLVKLLNKHKKECLIRATFYKEEDNDLDMVNYNKGKVKLCEELLRDLDKICPTCTCPKLKSIIIEQIKDLI